MLYNNETFNKYCEDNEITLLENYEQIKLNRDYKIKGRCITMKNEEVKQKLKNTVLEKYGVEHISQLDTIKEQIKSTCLAKYGTEFSLQSEEVKKKSKATTSQQVQQKHQN